MAEPLPSPTYVTSEELSKHNKPGDLWISIHGKIYDVSDWSHHHPGGDLPLLTLAGHDATDAFLAFHRPSASRHLARFFTGHHLKNYSVSPVSSDYRSLLTHLTSLGLFETKGHVTFLTLILILTLLVISIYGILFSESTCVHLLSAALIGFTWIQSGWLGHDSGHYQISLSLTQSWRNCRLLPFRFCLGSGNVTVELGGGEKEVSRCINCDGVG